MKVHTNAFKEQIKEMGRELNSLITFGSTELGAEQLNSVTPSFESSILKSAMKMLEIDSNVEIPKGSVVNYKFGVKVNGVYEYLNFGNYIVKEVEKQEDTLSYKIVCYDKMLNTMKEYTTIQDGVFPMTVRDYINSLCLDCGLTFKNVSDEFANYDKIIESDLYANLGYTYRDIFDELSAVTGSTICLNNEDNVEVRYITDTLDTIDEEYLKDINVNFGEKYGPVNSIVLSRSGESDNVYLQDEESVTSNGLTELKIIDNQIMNFNNRADFLPDLLSKLNGLEYYLNDFSSTGITYYDICDRYNVKVYDKEYSCVMFNNEMLVTQGLEENIFTERPKETKTDYSKSDKDDRRINQVYIIVDKQKEEINLVASKKVGKDEVVSTINQSAEQITLKGNRVVIESDNFNLTADGTVQAVAGEIAGFNISNEGFYYLLQPKKDYKNEDFTKLNNYIIGTGTLTDDEKNLYDMNNDGLLNVLDLSLMNWVIEQKISHSSPGKFQIKIPEKGENPFALEFGLYNGVGEIINGFKYDESTLQNLTVNGILTLRDTTKQKYGTIDKNSFIYGKTEISNDGIISIPKGTVAVNPTVLYNNVTGTNDTVFLSDNVDNFDYIEIYYNKEGLCGFTKIYSPNGKTAILSLSNFIDTVFQIVSKWVEINGTIISVVSDSSGYLNAYSTDKVEVISENKIYITRVIGYK